MIEIAKKIIITSLTFAVMVLVAVSLTAGEASSAEKNKARSSKKIEDGGDNVLPFDDVITGTMDEMKNRLIYVDGMGHRLCKEIQLFTPLNVHIPLENIEGAEQVKIFKNKGCVRKIKVLYFAQ